MRGSLGEDGEGRDVLRRDRRNCPSSGARCCRNERDGSLSNPSMFHLRLGIEVPRSKRWVPRRRLDLLNDFESFDGKRRLLDLPHKLGSCQSDDSSSLLRDRSEVLPLFDDEARDGFRDRDDDGRGSGFSSSDDSRGAKREGREGGGTFGRLESLGRSKREDGRGGSVDSDRISVREKVVTGRGRRRGGREDR